MSMQQAKENLINRLGIKDALKIGSGNEKIDDNFILFTYTTGRGDTPECVETFLKNNPDKIKAVIGTGNIAFHADTFAFAADNIAKKCNVPVLYKLDGGGDATDEKRLKLLLGKWIR